MGFASRYCSWLSCSIAAARSWSRSKIRSSLLPAIGAVMTGIYLFGMLERQDRTVFGIGWDSAAVVLVYLGGMTVLYFIT